MHQPSEKGFARYTLSRRRKCTTTLYVSMIVGKIVRTPLQHASKQVEDTNKECIRQQRFKISLVESVAPHVVTRVSWSEMTINIAPIYDDVDSLP